MTMGRHDMQLRSITSIFRQTAKWMACAAAAACCVAGVALPAHAVDEEPISLPQTAPSQAPSPGFLPGHILKISARLDRTTYETGDDEIEWVTHYYVFVRNGPYGAEITRDDCQQIANTFWAGSADNYTASAVYDLSGCTFDAYYLKDAQHAFYSLDESGHIEVRAPLADLSQFAQAFENATITDFEIDFSYIRNAQCNGNPSRTDIDREITADRHSSTCTWSTFDGATIPTTDDPLMVGDIEPFFTTYTNGTVGPFTDLVAPVNPFTITPAPTTDPATGPSAAASEDRSETGKSSSTGLLIGIGAAIAALLLVGTGALVIALRRRK